jgi:hypothetical protein
MVNQGRQREAGQVVDEMARRAPRDVSTLQARALLERARGNRGAAVAAMLELAEAPDRAAMDLNQSAWFHLVENIELPRALELARMAVATAAASDTALHTLASIEAELGDLHAAKEDVLKAMGLAGRSTPTGAEWYVFGRIAEHLGLRGDAEAAYRKIKDEPDIEFMPDVDDLARRRLTGKF